jgi:hypothetical protein
MKDVVNASKQKKCLSIQNKIHLCIKIIDKNRNINFNQWMKMCRVCSFCNVSQFLPCIDVIGCEYLGGLSHHPMVEMKNTKNRRAKMHANLLC